MIEIEPGLLQQPHIPKPLHGLNPRSIMGTPWWDAQRRIAYASTDYHCLACGVHKSEALIHTWLEAHEIYSINYDKGLATFTRIVPLCPACHKYIHSGLLYINFKQGKIPIDQVWLVLRHGTDTLIDNWLDTNAFADLIIKYLKEDGYKIPTWAKPLLAVALKPDEKSSCVPWHKWRLSFEGKLYKPLFNSFEEWQEHYLKEC